MARSLKKQSMAVSKGRHAGITENGAWGDRSHGVWRQKTVPWILLGAVCPAEVCDRITSSFFWERRPALSRTSDPSTVRPRAGTNRNGHKGLSRHQSRQMFRAARGTICPSTTWSPSPGQQSPQRRRGGPRSRDSRVQGSRRRREASGVLSVFGHRFALFLGRRTASEGKGDPRYSAASPSPFEHSSPSRVQPVPHRPFSEPVWLSACHSQPPVLPQLTDVWHPGITYAKTFSSTRRETHGLHYSRTRYSLSLNFMTIPLSPTLWVRFYIDFHRTSRFCKLKTRNRC